jgi:hypothetical protein
MPQVCSPDVTLTQYMIDFLRKWTVWKCPAYCREKISCLTFDASQLKKKGARYDTSPGERQTLSFWSRDAIATNRACAVSSARNQCTKAAEAASWRLDILWGLQCGDLGLARVAPCPRSGRITVAGGADAAKREAPPVSDPNITWTAQAVP